MADFTGLPRGEGRRIAVVASRFNETVTTRLAEGAVDALGMDDAYPIDDLDEIGSVPADADGELRADDIAYMIYTCGSTGRRTRSVPEAPAIRPAPCTCRSGSRRNG